MCHIFFCLRSFMKKAWNELHCKNTNIVLWLCLSLNWQCLLHESKWNNDYNVQTLDFAMVYYVFISYLYFESEELSVAAAAECALLLERCEDGFFWQEALWRLFFKEKLAVAVANTTSLLKSSVRLVSPQPCEQRVVETSRRTNGKSVMMHW